MQQTLFERWSLDRADPAGRRSKELSRGYKQRVGMAHAMIGDPAVLILDEPTSGLDPNQLVKIRSIIKEIGARKTVILSTHILNEAESACDRIVIINAGTIVADGTPKALRSKVSQTHMIRLSLRKADTERVNRALSQIRGVVSVRLLQADGSSGLSEFELSCSSDVSDEVYRKIKSGDWVLAGFSVEQSSLEEVFRGLTGKGAQRGGAKG